MIKAMPGYAVIKLPDSNSDGKSKSGIITGQQDQEVNNQGIIEDFDLELKQTDLGRRLDYCMKNKFTVIVRPFSGQIMAYDKSRYLVVSISEIQAIKE
jgi:co-chaperonin GroES (HSP10)